MVFGVARVLVHRFSRFGRVVSDRPALAVRLVSRSPVPMPREDSVARAPWRWWRVYGCGKRPGFVSTGSGDVLRGERCGTAGCHSCDKDRLSKVVAPARAFAHHSALEWSLYTFTLGVSVDGAFVGAPAETVDDVSDVWARMRATVRSGLRSGLWAGGCWVTEVEPLRGGGLSRIPCPYRRSPPASGPCPCGVGCSRCSGSLVDPGADPSAVAAHLLCLAGACSLCAGHGVLPLGHVHIHALVLGRPVWYSDPSDPAVYVRHRLQAESSDWHTAPGGRGFLSWVRRLGWGRCSRESISSDAAAAHYVGKAASAYAAKGSPGVVGSFYTAAYLRSGGLLRAAGSFGCLYGLTASRSDPWRSGWSPGESAGVVVSPEFVKLEASLLALPVVTVVQGDPSISSARWAARDSVSDSAAVASLSCSEYGSALGADGGGATSAYPPVPGGSPSLAGVAAVSCVAAVGRPLSSSSGANSTTCDSASALRYGPLLAAAPAVEWWSPWVLHSGVRAGTLDPLWYVGGAGTSARAFRSSFDAAAYAGQAALSRVLGVLSHEWAGRLRPGSFEAGSAALRRWARSAAVRIYFPGFSSARLVEVVIAFARSSPLSSDLRLSTRARVASDIYLTHYSAALAGSCEAT